MKHFLLDESSFAILFPHYRERYLTEIWPHLEQIFQPFGIVVELDTTNSIMMVRTTSKTWDPVAILKARDVIKLLGRSVPVEQAIRVLEDGVESMVIVIGQERHNSDRWVKRRQRLIDPNGDTLKALELLTQCYILVQGRTVAAIGSARGLETVERVAIDCMNNIHPVYHIKTLMVRQELEKRPELANEDWRRFLPKFKKLNKPSKGKRGKHEPRNQDALPDFPPEAEVDRQIEDGEFFQKQKGNERRKRRKKREKEVIDEAPPEEVEPVREAAEEEVPSALELARTITKRKQNE